jgi:hypothetical protein
MRDRDRASRWTPRKRLFEHLSSARPQITFELAVLVPDQERRLFSLAAHENGSAHELREDREDSRYLADLAGSELRIP